MGSNKSKELDNNGNVVNNIEIDEENKNAKIELYLLIITIILIVKALMQSYLSYKKYLKNYYQKKLSNV